MFVQDTTVYFHVEQWCGVKWDIDSLSFVEGAREGEEGTRGRGGGYKGRGRRVQGEGRRVQG